MDQEKIRSTILKRDAKGVVRHGAEWLALWSDPHSMRSDSERSADAVAERHRLQLAARLSAAARSLSGRGDLDVQIGDADPTQATPAQATPARTVSVPRTSAQRDLRASLDELTDSNMPALRGRIDSTALFLRFHDPTLHATLAPDTPGERRLFELLERLRCEAAGARRWPGIGDNLVAAQKSRLARLDLLNAHLASLVPLDEALRMVVGDTLIGRRDVSMPVSGFWMWNRWMRDRLQPELDALAAAVDDQAAYARTARTLIAELYAALQGKGEGPIRRELRSRSGTDGPDHDDDADGVDAGKGDEHFEPGPEMLSDDETAGSWPLVESSPDARRHAYSAYTTSHDRTVRAEDLVPQQIMRQVQIALEKRRGSNKRTLARLVAQLQRRLMATQTRSWTFDLEEGLIDASRLDRVIVNPGFADAYKQEEESPFRDTCVTILIDNSGSMRGKTIELACVAADLICAALDNCSVATEVLGFTTVGWKGGQSTQDWISAGRPADPGRLNDLLHIVYKSADEPYRRAKLNLCAMLSPDLLKENIDGEALAWAVRRLTLRAEQRRILLVISDGAPVDQATLEANDDKEILDRHLREVIAEIERGGQVELAAIGVRHDVDRYYRAARRVDTIDDLGPALVEALDALLLRSRPGYSRHR
jgi:cobaltochelatase CobT